VSETWQERLAKGRGFVQQVRATTPVVVFDAAGEPAVAHVPSRYLLHPEPMAKEDAAELLPEPYRPLLIDPERKHETRVIKADAAGDQRLFFNVVLEPEVTDSQGDIYSAEEIELAAHLWMADFLNLGLGHKGLINDGATPVESWIQRNLWKLDDGQEVIPGTWVLGAKIHDDQLWQAFKSGELNAWSIEGWAKKTLLTAAERRTLDGGDADSA
jgi:hypothetical protein